MKVIIHELIKIDELFKKKKLTHKNDRKKEKNWHKKHHKQKSDPLQIFNWRKTTIIFYGIQDLFC